MLRSLKRYLRVQSNPRDISDRRDEERMGFPESLDAILKRFFSFFFFSFSFIFIYIFFFFFFFFFFSFWWGGGGGRGAFFI